MPQHILRKDLKKDEFRETLAHGAEAVLSHQQLTTYVLIAAVVVAAGVFAWRTYSERQSVKANAAYDEAIRIFQAPVGVPPAPGEPNYTDNIKKFTDAQQKFSDLAKKYPRTRAALLGRYYSALCFEKLEKNAQAQEALQGLTGSSDAEVAAMAKFELAGLDDHLGQPDAAAKLYQDLIAKPTVLVPKAFVMLTLANHYAAKNPAEAAKLYNQIKTDYPDTPIAQQADQALSLLPGKS